MSDDVVRPARPDEAPAVGHLVRAAFGADDPAEGELVADLVDDLRAAGHVRAELVAGSPPVGHVVLTRAWLDARERLVDVLVLSPLSVAPERQGAGLGAALVGAAVAAARDLGAPALFLEGDPGYYGRHGFEPGERHGFERPSARIPAPAFQVVVLPAHEPWMTGRLVYPDPFWARDAVGLRDPLLARLERDGP